MSVYRVVTYVVRDRPEFGLMPGYCIMSLRHPYPDEWAKWKSDHVLKTWPEFYRAVQSGAKTLELRKDDRTPRYSVGQMIELVYFDPAPAPAVKEGE